MIESYIEEGNQNRRSHLWQIHHRPVPWLGGFQRSDLYHCRYVPLTHIPEKESRLRDFPRASGSQSDMFLTASWHLRRAFYFIEGSTFTHECITVFPMKQRGAATQTMWLHLFLCSFLSFLYSFSIIYLFISRLLIRADAPQINSRICRSFACAYICVVEISGMSQHLLHRF